MGERLQNFIDGRFVPAQGAGVFEVISPVTGEQVALAPVSETGDVEAAFAAASGAFATWKAVTPSQRQKHLLALADAVEAHADELVEAQHRNTGQPRAIIAAEEVAAGADQLRFFAGAARMLEGRAAAEYMEGHTSYVRREPVGVIAQITPWNFPLMMAIWKIGPALAAGNTVVLKPSETTPESTLVLARLAGEIFPAGVVNVVLGDASTGALLSQHPSAVMVSLTGSVRAGEAVASQAGLKRTHLELGGKAPAVVFGDVDLGATAKALVEFGTFNAGQDCTALTRVLVEDAVHDELVEHLVAAAQATVTGEADEAKNDYGPLNNARHFASVKARVESLPQHARIVTGGRAVQGSAGFFFEPTIITGVKQSDAIVQEETFGPVITVQSFSSEQEALELANGVDYALASSVWTTDGARGLRFTRDLDFGCVWVNTHLLLVAEMPHGGFKSSGHGKDLSGYAVEEYTRVKHVMHALGA
ncbi:aminobutyraldehyde dehydrogenase [Nesterenkonia xinjiangensis]|uniref:1-pyrroline dehydrogenase n=1 Tax=Nesterenkonia xinjiangensis TaxID=225327 RepID=A0A7Z0GL60_9MICC|nr:aminobutyraldehyde dehydrogenase [Nesterenkonia xinjiangensis]NYJ77146.1 1-pyrroline dehydrogenase [Nesterenkonia xinjiangensis]